jgi:signal-transduction protein with cAMP-binding, CBS, and nucleotidyltransferase domain
VALDEPKPLESVPDTELVQLAEAIQVVAFKPGEDLGTEQKLGGLHIVKSGSVQLQTTMAHDTKMRTLSAGQYFGFEAMVHGRGLDPTQQAQALSGAVQAGPDHHHRIDG